MPLGIEVLYKQRWIQSKYSNTKGQRCNNASSHINRGKVIYNYKTNWGNTFVKVCSHIESKYHSVGIREQKRGEIIGKC